MIVKDILKIYSGRQGGGERKPEAIETLRCYPRLDDLFSIVGGWF